jgi:zinc protease
VAVATDPEAQGSSVSVLHTRPLHRSLTVGDYRRDLVRTLFEDMINARLGEIARRADAPFLAASVGDDVLGRTVEAFGASARVVEGGIPKGLDAVEQELARVRQFGFSEAELDRVKKSTLAAYERAYNERDKAESTTSRNSSSRRSRRPRPPRWRRNLSPTRIASCSRRRPRRKA